MARLRLGKVRWLVPYKEGLPESLGHFVDESDSYNALHFLDPKTESFVATCDAYAGILVAPDRSGEVRDGGFFTGNGQMAVSGVLMQLVENYKDQATVPEIASIVCSNRIFEFARTAMDTGSAHVKDRLATFGNREAPLLKGGIGDILRTMREQLKWASDPAIARILKTPVNPWRFNDLKDELGTVYVGVSAKFSSIAHKLNRWLMGCCAMDMQSTGPGKYRACLLADEFPMMGKVEIFETICAEGAGHGFTVWPIVQNCGQLVSTYGEEGYRNILSACEVQIFLTPRDMETASEIERLAGKKTILTCSFSHGGQKRNDWDGMNIGEAGASVLDAHKVMALPEDRMIVVAPGLVPDLIIARRKPYWKYSDIYRWCDPNPYAPGGGNSKQTSPSQRQSLDDLVARARRLQKL